MLWMVLQGCPAEPDPAEPPSPPVPTEATASTADTACVPSSETDICDGIDNDCDGDIDENPDLFWYPDADGDGLGDADEPALGCDRPDNHVETPGDCDDLDPTLDAVVGDLHWTLADAKTVGLTAPQWDGNYRPCTHETLAGGAAVGDIDDDGDIDLFLPRLYQPDQLLLNDGTGVFSEAPGFVGDTGGANGALFVDVDADRDLDLYVSMVGIQDNLLYINDGTGTFTEEAAARGATTPAPGCSDQSGVSAGDIDGDGDLDLIIAGWQEESMIGLGDRTRLLRNDGTGHFTDATVATGLDDLWQRAPFTIALADRDDDGDPDLYVAGDWNTSGTYRNDGGVFVDDTDPAVITDENGMGGDLGDVDGDGDLDWFVTSIWDDGPVCPEGWGCTGNRLYIDQGDTLTDGTAAAGVYEGQWSWGAVFLDQDLDGDLDLALTGGYPVLQFWYAPGRMWHNDGTGVFTDVTCETNWVERGQGRTMLPADVNRDGQLDLIVVRSSDEPELYLAAGAEAKGWLEVELSQPGLNPYGIGAMVTVEPTAGAAAQVRLLHANASFVGGHAPEVHFGLDDHLGPAHEVRVRWPDGGQTVHNDVGPGFVRLQR